MLARVVAAVRCVPNVPSLSDEQLQAILAIAATPPAATSPASTSSAGASTSLTESDARPAADQPAAATYPPAPAQAEPNASAAPLSTPAKQGSAASLPTLHWQTTEYLGAACKRPTKPTTAPPPAPASANSHKRRHAGGGLQWGQLHVALWDKSKKQRVPAKAYSGDLHSYLALNPHLEVYNQQDAAARTGAQPLAGQKLAHERDPSGEARIVLWDGREHRKLPTADCPTPAGLCAFLRAHPHVEIFSGQQPLHSPSPPPPTTETNIVKQWSLMSPTAALEPALLAAAPVEPLITAAVDGATSQCPGVKSFLPARREEHDSWAPPVRL